MTLVRLFLVIFLYLSEDITIGGFYYWTVQNKNGSPK